LRGNGDSTYQPGSQNGLAPFVDLDFVSTLITFSFDLSVSGTRMSDSPVSVSFFDRFSSVDTCCAAQVPDADIDFGEVDFGFAVDWDLDRSWL